MNLANYVANELSSWGRLSEDGVPTFFKPKQVPIVLSALGDLEIKINALAEENPSAQVFLDSADRWVESIIDFASNPGPSAALASTERELQMLGALLRTQEVELSPDAANSIRESLNDLIDGLAEDTNLPADLRRYANEVISDVEKALRDYEITNTFDAQRAAERLLAAASYLGANDVAKGKDPSRWQKIWGRLINSVVNIGEGTAITAAETLMIGPG